MIARPPETLGADPFFPSLHRRRRGRPVTARPVPVLQVVRDRERESEGYRRLAADGRVDGVFLTDLRVADPRPALLAEIGLPAVLDRTVLHRPPVACVSVDDRPGIRAAVEHLVGARPPAHRPRRRARRVRPLGCPGARRGPAPCATPGCSRGCSSAPTSPPRAARPPPSELLDLADPPTAIVYANDLMAIAGTAAAAGRGLAVPGDLSVTGFDDTEVAAHLTAGTHHGAHRRVRLGPGRRRTD